jgi:hypothetical protein
MEKGKREGNYLDSEAQVLAIGKLLCRVQVVGDEGVAASIMHGLFHGLIKLKQIQRKLDPLVLQLP